MNGQRFQDEARAAIRYSQEGFGKTESIQLAKLFVQFRGGGMSEKESDAAARRAVGKDPSPKAVLHAKVPPKLSTSSQKRFQVLRDQYVIAGYPPERADNMARRAMGIE